MSIPSFYYSQLEADDSLVSLDANEASHAVKSRRLRVGQNVRLFNGLGMEAIGALSVVERRSVLVKLDTIKQLEAPARKVTVAVAIPKGDRQKVMIDMLTQLGVFRIIPLRCQYSVTKFNHSTSEKWLRVAIEACKQSQNPWLPIIASEQGLDQLLGADENGVNNGKDNQTKLVVANADGDSVLSLAQSSSEITVLIGPEGGFSEQEFAKLKQFSVPSMRVGPYILRTEAAAIAAAGMLLG
jgi:16S rRNA (uracil1498-N3)-methyltransferase